jgi:ATP-dependent helicase/nuclease subunit A
VQPHGKAFETGAPASRVGAGADRPIVIPQLPELPPPRDTVPAAAPGAPPSFAARLGRAVHRVLQWAAAGVDAPDYATLTSAAVAEFDLPPSAGQAVASYACTIRDSAALQRFFDPRQTSWSADEFDIVHEGTALRLDRLVRFGPANDAQWWVLDYKLALDAAGDATLRQQLERYRSAVRLLANGAPVHAAFVTGDGALHELQADVAPATE